MIAVCNPISDKKSYQGEADVPKLPTPLDGKPCYAIEPAAKNLVTGFIIKEITMLLADISSPDQQREVFNYLVKGTPLTTLDLQEKAEKIKHQVEAKVHQETRLKNFSLKALYQPTTEAWIQTPLSSYSKEEQKEIENEYLALREEIFNTKIKNNPEFAKSDHIRLLAAALRGEKVDPNIKNAFTQLNFEAAKIIQEKYALASNWSFEETNPSKWLRIDQGFLNPSAIAAARSHLLEDNQETVVINYLDLIIDALYDLKEVLSKKLMMQLEQTKTNTDFKREDIALRADLTDKTAADMDKSAKRQRTLGVFSKVVTAIGIILSGVSILLTIASAGLLSPIAMAALAVTGVMITYSAVDAITGVTAKVFTQINELVDEMTSSMPDALAASFKAAAVVAIIAVVAIAVILSAPTGGSAGTTIAASTLSQAVRLATRQLAVQFTLILVMSSGVLLEFPAEMIALTGLDESSQKIVQLLVLVTEMILVLLVATKATNSLNQVPGATAPPKAPLLDRVKTSAATIKEELGRTAHAIQVAIFKAAQAATQPKETMVEALKSSKTILETGAKGFVSSLVKPGAILEERLKTGNISKVQLEELRALNQHLRVLNITSSTVFNMVEACFQYSIYKINAQLAETQEAEAQLKALLENLDAVIRQLQSSPNNEMINSVSQSIKTLFRSASAASSKLYNSYQG